MLWGAAATGWLFGPMAWAERVLATAAADGGLLISSKSVGRSTREAWLRRVGSETPTGHWPKEGASADARLRCDTLGCVYRASTHVVAVVLRGEALLDDCRVADVVVSLVPVRGACASARTLIDRFDLWREGAHAVWLNDRQVRVESVADARGDRPWVIRPRGLSDQGEEDAGGVREATGDAPAGDTQ
jgi:competence protein ComEC